MSAYMGVRVSDLPADWLVWRLDITNKYAEELDENFRHKSCEVVFLNQFERLWRHGIPELDKTILSQSLEVRQATRMLNCATFCYVGATDLSPWNLQTPFDRWPTNFVRSWRKENAVRERLCRYPLCGLELSDEDDIWYMDQLPCLMHIDRKRLEAFRAYGPPNDQIELPKYGNHDKKLLFASLVPTCRAAFLLASSESLRCKRIVFVLTGDNDELLSEAPTLASISDSQATVVNFGNIALAEVSLGAAEHFISELETREVQANDDLRIRNEKRDRLILAQFYEEARKAVGELADRSLGSDCHPGVTTTALLKVLGKEIWETVLQRHRQGADRFYLRKHYHCWCEAASRVKAHYGIH